MVTDTINADCSEPECRFKATHLAPKEAGSEEKIPYCHLHADKQYREVILQELKELRELVMNKTQ